MLLVIFDSFSCGLLYSLSVYALALRLSFVVMDNVAFIDII